MAEAEEHQKTGLMEIPLAIMAETVETECKTPIQELVRITVVEVADFHKEVLVREATAVLEVAVPAMDRLDLAIRGAEEEVMVLQADPADLA